MNEFPKLTNEDLEKMFNVHRATLIEWRKRGLPYYKLGGKIFYEKNEVMEWVQKNRRIDTDK